MVTGLGMALALPLLLDALGRGFLDLARAPFEKVGAQLIVQRGVTGSALPKEMGIMLPYSAQVITDAEWETVSAMDGVTSVAGFVQLWNLGAGRFYTLGGIPLDPDAALIGPGKVRDWIIAGRMPRPGEAEAVVERHYAAFFGLKPGTRFDVGGTPFTVVGIVDLKSQVGSSNLYLDVDVARRLGKLGANEVNQLYVTLSASALPEGVREQIAASLSSGSVISADGVLRMLGGIAQTLGGLRSVTLVGSSAIALGLIAVLVYGTWIERRRDGAVLAALGWSRRTIHGHLAAEVAVQGLLGGLLALAFAGVGMAVLSSFDFTLPKYVGTELPVSSATDTVLPPLRLGLTLTVPAWSMAFSPLLGATLAGLLCWMFSKRNKRESPWRRLKAG